MLLQSLGIIAGLLFTGVTLRRDARSRRISNLIDLTSSHREIWVQFDRRPALSRVLDPNADVSVIPVTHAERIFVTLVILHLGSVYHAIREALSVPPDGLREDVSEFFSLPIPGVVWQKSKSLQDREFVAFVDDCLREGSGSGRSGKSNPHANRPFDMRSG